MFCKSFTAKFPPVNKIVKAKRNFQRRKDSNLHILIRQDPKALAAAQKAALAAAQKATAETQSADLLIEE